MQKYLATYEPLAEQSGESGGRLQRCHAESRSCRQWVHAPRSRVGPAQPSVSRGYTINDERSVLAGSFPELPDGGDNACAAGRYRPYLRGRGVDQRDALFLHPAARVRSAGERFRDAMCWRASAFKTRRPILITFGLPALVVTDYDMVQDSDTLPQTQRDNTTYLGTQPFADAWAAIPGRPDFNSRISPWRICKASSCADNTNSTEPTPTIPSNPSNTGDPFADFLLSDASETTRDVGTTQAYLRQNGYAAFVQDEWRVTLAHQRSRSACVMNTTSPFTDDHGTLLNLNYSTLPAAPQLRARENRRQSAISRTSRRVSVWPRRLIGNTVFRAGYGIYYSDETRDRNLRSAAQRRAE